jgi:hypothetical protein
MRLLFDTAYAGRREFMDALERAGLEFSESDCFLESSSKIGFQGEEFILFEDPSHAANPLVRQFVCAGVKADRDEADESEDKAMSAFRDSIRPYALKMIAERD